MIASRHHYDFDSRPGFSLLEVVLSVGVFAVAWGGLSVLMNQGLRATTEANLRSTGLQIAESQLDAMNAGVVPLATTPETPILNPEGWTWSATVEPGPIEPVLAVRIEVRSPRNDLTGPVAVSVRTLVRDPALLPIDDSLLTEEGIDE